MDMGVLLLISPIVTVSCEQPPFRATALIISGGVKKSSNLVILRHLYRPLFIFASCLFWKCAFRRVASSSAFAALSLPGIPRTRPRVMTIRLPCISLISTSLSLTALGCLMRSLYFILPSSTVVRVTALRGGRGDFALLIGLGRGKSREVFLSLPSCYSLSFSLNHLAPHRLWRISLWGSYPISVNPLLNR